MKTKTFEFLELLENFLNSYLPYSIGASTNTVTSYKYAFRLLLTYLYEKKGIMADRITFTSLDYDTLLAFLSWLETDRGCSAATRNQRLSALSSFSEYAQNRNFEAAMIFRANVNKIPAKKQQHMHRAVFTKQEVKILLETPRNSTVTERRDQIILSVMYASGARAQEICDLKVMDIRLNGDSTILILNGKGGKHRRVGIPNGCTVLLQQYMCHKKLDEQKNQYVFSSQTHEHMTVSCVEEIFKKYLHIAKTKHPELFPENSYPPHSMRHTTATHMLEAGVPIAVIKNFLGHSSLQSTQIYAEVTQSTVDKHLKAWNEKWAPKPDMSAESDETNVKMPEFLKKI